jgi:hypothetical protein
MQYTGWGVVNYNPNKEDYSAYVWPVRGGN